MKGKEEEDVAKILTLATRLAHLQPISYKIEGIITCGRIKQEF